MITIKPSEGNNYYGQDVFVEGKIAGPKTHTAAYGGRWVIRIADLGSPSGEYQAVLVLNEDPDKNPRVCALGVGSPNEAIKTLFNDKFFEPLFQEEITFRAEAIVGIYDGLPWFNISQIILIEPQFMIGTRQIYSEPICERRLLLRARGIRSNRNNNESPLSGPFIGNLVHSCFQQIITSTSKESLVIDFKHDPKMFLLRIIQPEVILLGGMGLLGDSPRLDGNEWVTVKNQIDRLIESEQVQNLLHKESEWFSEVPVSGTSIHGDIDLRSASRIIELKTGLLRSIHSGQVCAYLVGEMIEHGFSIKDHREAYLISSSGQIQDDNLRVQKILGNSDKTLETLNRFLLTRHRLLMVSAGRKLPKINCDAPICKNEECEFFISEQGKNVKSRCHFYCQTDRNWSCKKCPHVSLCTEYLKYHSFDVLDEANRIRDSLNQEIEFARKWLKDVQPWSSDFEIVSTGFNKVMLLKPLSCYSFDPPSPGDKIIIKSESQDYATNGLMVKICDDDNNWMIINRGRVPDAIGTRIKLVQPRSELNGIYYLQACLDELQCLGEISNREGISFAGGSIVSGRPEISDNLQLVLSDHLNTDIFCQSFDIKISKQILQDVINTVKGRILIVTDVKNLPLDHGIDIRGEQLLTLTSTATSITNACIQVKDHLEKHNQWITSPDVLLNTDIFFALPNRGRNYFDYIIIFETNSVTGLEYFLMRQFGKHMITIGDANCIGRNLHSNNSKLLGLGDNLMTRVYGRGFPRVEGKMIPQIVCLKNQPLDPMLNNALKSCRMIPSDSGESKRSIDFITCNSSPSQDNLEQLIYSFEFDHPEGGPFMELRLKTDELLSSIEMENDLIDLVPLIHTGLFENYPLRSPSSGRRYVVMQAPSFRDDGSRWITRFYTTANPLRTNISEGDEVIRTVKKLVLSGVKPKNIAIMSTSNEQLELIIKNYGKDLQGISLRTPYGIRGENWGNIIISCVSNSPQDIDVRELYTMIRASITRVIFIGQPNILKYHPLLRKMNITVSKDKN